MPTTPLGIWYPGSSDVVTPLETAFSTMASSIDNVLAGGVQIHRVDNITQRNALVSQFPPSATDPLVVWRADATNGQELEYTKNGTTWYYVSTSEDDTGWVSLTLQNGWSASNPSPRVRRVGKVVSMEGRVTGGSGVIATLDAQFRPGQNNSFYVRDGGGIAGSALIVNANGTVSPAGNLSQPNLTSTWFAAN